MSDEAAAGTATEEDSISVVTHEDRVDLHDPVQRERAEGAIRALPGVVAARLVPGMDRPIDELHVLTVPGKGPKQVVRDVQSLLFARFGVSSDHRVISVVQIHEAENVLRARRVAISSVGASNHDLLVDVTVALSDEEGNTYEGMASGPSSAAGRRRATARATLEAARPLLGQRRMVECEGVTVLEVLGHEVAIAFVHFHGPQADTTVSGSAIVRGDEAQAVARAILDALNRELEDATAGTAAG